MLNTDLRLYAVRVGSVGSFLVAAIDRAQAVAIAEAWQAEWPNRSGRIIVKPFADPRALITFAF